MTPCETNFGSKFHDPGWDLILFLNSMTPCETNFGSDMGTDRPKPHGSPYFVLKFLTCRKGIKIFRVRVGRNFGTKLCDRGQSPFFVLKSHDPA